MKTSEIWIERAQWVDEKKTGQERQTAVQFNSYKKKARYFEKFQEAEKY